jgi:hypothetical protein
VPPGRLQTFNGEEEKQMAPEIECRRFEAHDKNGNRWIILAEREVILALGIYERLGPWRFRLEDGRAVRRVEQDDSYLVERGSIRLTSADPSQPED